MSLTIQNPQSYHQTGGTLCVRSRPFWAAAPRAADFNVYWGEGGVVDSVIDVTHNVEVPFGPTASGAELGLPDHRQHLRRGFG